MKGIFDMNGAVSVEFSSISDINQTTLASNSFRTALDVKIHEGLLALLNGKSVELTNNLQTFKNPKLYSPFSFI